VHKSSELPWSKVVWGLVTSSAQAARFTKSMTSRLIGRAVRADLASRTDPQLSALCQLEERGVDVGVMLQGFPRRATCGATA